MRVNIISEDNGVGLTQDVSIISSLLYELGHEVKFLDRRFKNFAKADLNIFCEHLDKHYIPLAPKNICIPNPEWFHTEWFKLLNWVDLVLCKTIDTAKIFDNHTKNWKYTSFTSIDKYNKNVKREREFIHLAGKSSHKNTEAVIKAWQQNPDFNTLHFISRQHKGIYNGNINYKNFVKDIDELMNKCLFHVCPSEYEGFGHYINEARSVGAIIISNDCPPMNEMVNSSFGFLTAPTTSKKHHNGICYKTTPDSVAEQVLKCIQLTDKEIKQMREKSRQEYLDNDLFFRNEFKQIIKDI